MALLDTLRAVLARLRGKLPPLARSRDKIRFNQTPPIELWRTFPLWEYCIDEEGTPGQDEGTLRPSDAPHWNFVSIIPRPVATWHSFVARQPLRTAHGFPPY